MTYYTIENLVEKHIRYSISTDKVSKYYTINKQSERIPPLLRMKKDKIKIERGNRKGGVVIEM